VSPKNLRTSVRFACLAIALWLGFAIPTFAADSPLSQLMSAPAVNLLTSVRPHLVSQLASNSAVTPLDRPPSRFQPSGRRLILAQVVHAMSGGDASAEKIYRESIEEAFTGYEQQAATGGFPNDVAGSLALFVAATQLGTTGVEMTDAQSEVIARQLQVGLDTPDMRAAPDRVKQELYEFFGTFGLYLLITRQAAIGGHNDNALAQLKPLSSQALGWVLQVPSDSIVINDTGLHLATGSVADNVANPRTSPITVARSAPTTSGGPAHASALYGVWHGSKFGSEYSQTTNGYGAVTSYGVTSGNKIKGLAFFPNGWATCYIPSGGFSANTDCAAKAPGLPYAWGHYTFDGRKGLITYLQGAPLPFELVDGKITYDGTTYDLHGAFNP
jgi:hypothetical protein